MTIDAHDEIEGDNEVNAQPISAPTTLRAKVARSLEKTYKASFEAALAAKKWDEIAESKIPAAALEIFCIQFIDPSLDIEAAIMMLKRVKRHLIRLNLSVLQAFEKRMLADAIDHVRYQDEHFTTPISLERPNAEEPGWEDRVEAAQARLNNIGNDELREAI